MNLKHDEEASTSPAADGGTQKGGAVTPAEEAEVDKTLVEEAYKKIERVVMEKMTSMMEEVGAYLLDTFFDGDIEKAREQKPVKKKSFAQLIEKLGEKHPTIGKKSSLYNAINVAIDTKLFQEAEIPEYKNLGVTHKVYLTHVKDFNTKKNLAKEAAEKGFTTRELAEHINQGKKYKRLSLENLDNSEAMGKLEKKSPKKLKEMADSLKDNIKKLAEEKKAKAEEIERRYNNKIEAYAASEATVRRILEEKEKAAKAKEEQKVDKK